MWNKNQEEYNSPFDNGGNSFKNNIFETEAYSWVDDNQPYNFKYKDIEISWYKYLGRGTTINRKITPEEAINMFNDVLKSIKEMDKGFLDM